MSHILAQDLRNAVLQAAVQGRLTERFPEDTDIVLSVKTSLEEKKKMILAGEIQKEKPYSKSPKYRDYPFDIPEKWMWIRFGEIIVNKDSKRIPVSKLDREHRAKVYDYYGASGVIDKIDSYLFDETNMLIGEDGANLLLRSTPIAFFAEGKYWVNNHAHVLNVCGDISLEYICLYINAIDLSPYVTGTAQPKMNQENMNAIWVPLPPVEEQARIVARVDELMAKIDEYEKIEKELTELQKAFPGNMKDAILQAAFSGALSKQNENDHSAFDVLKELGISEPDDNPYDLPNNWIWTRFEDVSTYAKSKKKINGKDAEPATWMLDLEDIERGGKLLARKTVAERKAIGDKTIFTKGNILYAKLRPYLQKIIIAEADGICTPELVPFDMLGGINSKYALYYLKSPYVDSEVNKASYGVKMPRVGTETMKELRFPVCPAEEQVEIVRCLDTIIPLCDQLQEVA